ncbi:MAG: hypothetical protein ACM3PF_02505 [Bacteroidota bacterium]
MIPALNGWENFYVVVGSSAGALIGLQFVVITLIAERTRASMQQVAAFGSPTVVHFCAALLLSRDTMGSLFVIGAATLLLLFIGIHNSWDTVTYVALTYSPPTTAENPSRRNEE